MLFLAQNLFYFFFLSFSCGSPLSVVHCPRPLWYVALELALFEFDTGWGPVDCRRLVRYNKQSGGIPRRPYFPEKATRGRTRSIPFSLCCVRRLRRSVLRPGQSGGKGDARFGYESLSSVTQDEPLRIT